MKTLVSQGQRATGNPFRLTATRLLGLLLAVTLLLTPLTVLALGAPVANTMSPPNGVYGLYWDARESAKLGDIKAVASHGGNIYLAGHIDTASGNGSDVIVIKTDGAGNQLWRKTYNSGSGRDDEALAMAVDEVGNAYIAARSYNGTDYDIKVQKYDATTGTIQWTYTYGGGTSVHDEPVAIAVTGAPGVAASSIVVGGNSKPVLSIDGQFVTLMLDGSGTQQWVQNYDSLNGDDVLVGVALDAGGAVYAAGTRSNNNSGCGGCTKDIVALKYAAADGATLWAQPFSYDTGTHDEAFVVAAMAAGDLLIAGRTRDGGDSGTVLVRVDSASGAQVPTSAPQNLMGNNRPAALAVASNGDIYVAAAGNDIALAKFDSNGQFVWKQAYDNGGNRDEAIALGVDSAAQNVVVAGTTGSLGNRDLILVHWDSSGTLQGANSRDMGGDERLGGATSGVDGNGRLTLYLGNSSDKISAAAADIALSKFGVANADLQMDAVSGPALGVYGQTATISTSLTNIRDSLSGRLSDSGPFTVGLYLRDQGGVLADIMIGSFTLDLLSGASSTQDTVVPINKTEIPEGFYDLIAIADDGNAVTEYDESNNEANGGTMQVIDPPDLVVASVDSGATTNVLAAGSFDINYTVDNLRVTAASNVDMAFVLSSDTTVGNGDDIALTVSAGGTLANVAGFGSASGTATVAVPNTTPPGPYYIGAIVDPADTVIEGNENNNTLASSGQITIDPIVDLTVSAAHIASLDNNGQLRHGAVLGETIDVSTTVAAADADSGAATTADIYLSTDATITAADTYLGSRAVPALTAGSSDTALTAVTIPGGVATGLYYIGAIVDPAPGVITENNELNNTFSDSMQVSIGLPASDPSSLPDLIVTAIGTPQTTIQRGATMDITASVQNTLPTDFATTFRVGIYLSSDATINSSDFFLGDITVAGGLLGNSTVDLAQSFVLPTETSADIVWANLLNAGVTTSNDLLAYGSNWVSGATSGQILSGDGRVEYVAQDNTNYRSFGLTAAGEGPSLGGDYMYLLRGNGTLAVYENSTFKTNISGGYAAGDVLAVERQGSTVRYRKNGAVVYTSTVAAPGDLIGDFMINMSGVTFSGVQFITVAISNGAYYLGAVADYDVATPNELSESNNTAVSSDANNQPVTGTTVTAVQSAGSSSGGGSMGWPMAVLLLLSLPLLGLRSGRPLTRRVSRRR